MSLAPRCDLASWLCLTCLSILWQDLLVATPLAEVDFSQCRKCTPSYRALPAEYPKLLYTDRTPEEASALNDTVR